MFRCGFCGYGDPDCNCQKIRRLLANAIILIKEAAEMSCPDGPKRHRKNQAAFAKAVILLEWLIKRHDG